MADDLGRELALALELADIADAVTLRRFRARDLDVSRKADHTEVTEADRDAETAMRHRLSEARPDHAVLGEEAGRIGPADARCQWVLDPIDGTSNYVRGVPVWATLVALEVDGAPVVGVASAPALGRRWWGARDLGAYADGRPIAVSSVAQVEDAHVGHASVRSWRDHWELEPFTELMTRVARDRGFGDFWMHCLVAEGALDAAAEPVVSHWDLAALQPIVEAAGGRFTDLHGRARPDGGSALSSNGLLHDEVLAALARATR